MKNRRWLYWIMRNAGFQGFPYEYWHFDHENNPVGAYVAGKESASYGFAGDLDGDHNAVGPGTCVFHKDRGIWRRFEGFLNAKTTTK